MANEMMHLSGAVVANINTDQPDQVIYLDFCGTQDYSRQRWLLDPETLKACDEPMRDGIRVELTFNDFRKVYLYYMKQRLIENFMDMDDEKFEEYLIEGC